MGRVDTLWCRRLLTTPRIRATVRHRLEAANMDPILSKAYERRSELRRELGDIDRFIQLYEMLRRETDLPQQSLDLTEVQTDSEEQKVSLRSLDRVGQGVEEGESEARRGPTRDELRPFIDETLRGAGRPLSRGRLLKTLDNRGVRVGGEADRAKNLGTIMWRLKDHFVNLAGFGYWPKDTPYAPAGYVPEAPDSQSEALDPPEASPGPQTGIEHI